MRRQIAFVVTVLALVVVVFALTGCGNVMSIEEIAELAAARDLCNEAGGVFVQWGTEFGQMWKCDFDQRDSGD